MKVAVVGATGLVGGEIMKVLAERNFPVSELIPVASERSVGKTIEFKGKPYTVVSYEDAIAAKPDVAIFSAGGGTSLALAPKFAEAGITVIDNSSAWRMDPTKKLIVPEINAHTLTKEDKIIANPNCSTIQMVVVLDPLHRKYGIKRVVVSTYQSVTGTGKAAVDQLFAEREGNESAVTATTVRIPTIGGHSEAVNVEFAREFELAEVYGILENAEGVIVEDDVKNFVYPMPVNAHGRDEVFVGRIRRDETQPNTLNLWIVADNLRKGAATNAVQIAEYLVAKGLL